MLTQTDIRQSRPTDRDELAHIVCCVDDTLGLCGAILAEDAADAGPEDQECIVCDDLERNHYDFCPGRGQCIG